MSPVDQAELKRVTQTLRDRAELNRMTQKLRDLAWNWDPLGVVDDRAWIEREYDSIVNFTLSRLAKGSDAPALAADLRAFVDERFEIPTNASEVQVFVEGAIAAFQSND